MKKMMIYDFDSAAFMSDIHLLVGFFHAVKKIMIYNL